jgi:hypothetical protein
MEAIVGLTFSADSDHSRKNVFNLSSSHDAITVFFLQPHGLLTEKVNERV